MFGCPFDAVYKSQVHEARGSEQYNELMKCWNPLVKRALLDFTYEVERAFSPEPGVLLVRWRAEWRGIFAARRARLSSTPTMYRSDPSPHTRTWVVLQSRRRLLRIGGCGKTEVVIEDVFFH